MSERTRILLTGRDGQIGSRLQQLLRPVSDLLALGRQELDISNTGAVVESIRGFRPRVIINAAAYTDVEKAEGERDLAFRVNSFAPRLLAEEANRLDAVLIHYSTDYVFDGSKSAPYLETDRPNPLNVYGQSKLAGDQAIAETCRRHIILRTQWIYDRRGRNFMLRLLRKFRDSESPAVVDDQIGAPTSARMVASATGEIVKQVTTGDRVIDDSFGLFNVSAAGEASWYAFATEIAKHYNRMLKTYVLA